jgi:hypothetical protein
MYSGLVLSQIKIEKYDIYEITLETTFQGNPFRDVQLSAIFKCQDYSQEVKGFYDGEAKFKIRFMPQLIGEWKYITKSNIKTLDNKGGGFDCVQSDENVHGVVHVAHDFHFEYADGTPFYPIGTTCYAWIHQSEEVQKQTIKTLKNAPFNKIRMCVFPKWYEFNRVEPELYPYQGTGPDQWDFWQFNPEFFQHLESRISQIAELGIECDLILFHPYDGGHWDFDRMSDEQDDFYLRYVIARLAAFRNIWWSLANEFDFMEEKQTEDWDRFFKIIQEEDPYDHLRSIHNGLEWYDHSNPAVTHLSIQEDPWEDGGVGEFEQKIDRWREKYQKPVIIDEMKYEGNIKYSFGDLTAQEMTDRFWYTYTKGAYATHGETYIHPDNIIWWSRGGQLHGQSPERITFLREIIEDAPKGGLEACRCMEEDGNSVRVGEQYYLFYFGARQPAERLIFLPEEKEYTIDIIDTWKMTIERLEGTYSGNYLVPLPGKPFVAVRAVLKIRN